MIGDIYEHVTIWEYDDMAAFERAIQFLSKNPAFARFVAARDPLWPARRAGSCGLAAGAADPSLPEPAPFVVHEIHRVPLARKDAYLAYMTGTGLGILKAHGFRPAGPWVVDVGRWSEVTYLFRFDSLAERERLDRQVLRDRGSPGLRRQSQRVRRRDHDSPADPGALLAQAACWRGRGRKPATSAVLPHREQIAPGVHAAGFADRYHSANCGWVALGDETLLIDLPRGMPVPEFLHLGRRDHRQARPDAGVDQRPGRRIMRSFSH